MNKTSDNFTTPKQTKRLGLKRNSSVLKDSVEKPTTTTTLVCKTKSAPKRQPQSDVRVNYRNSEPAFHTPGTPKTSSDQQRQAVSTNCRPFRLSLSKKVREKMTKKRLEFHLANEIEKDDEEESEISMEVGNKTGEVNICQDKTKKISEEVKHEENNDSRSEIPGNMTSHDLKAQIEILRSDLIIRQEHAKKVSELQEAIDIWKQGFSSALSDLQGKIETRLDTETLLDQLKIPQEMIKYVND